MKKLFFTLSLMLAAMTAAAQTFTVNGLTYKVTSTTDLTAQVTSYSGIGGDVVIPATVSNGGTTYNVTAVGASAFEHSNISGITIPASVVSVGNTAFNFISTLKKIVISDADTPITFNGQGYATFDNGDTRYTVYVGRDITRTYRTGDSPFPQATTITWGPKVTEIGAGMAKSPYLVSAIIGDNVKSIGGSAFHSAGNSSDAETLTITMGKNVESMGNSAFYNCAKLTAITLPSVLKAIPNACFQYAPIREVVIPASVQSVGTTAFSFDDNLESIRIEDSDEAITFDGQQYATFDNGGARYTVYVGRDIKRTYRTGDSPFPQATTITWGPKVTEIGDGMAKSPYLVSAIIGSNVKSIGANAFHSAGNSSDAETLTITMGVNVESMGSSAFYNCAKLTAITLPSVLKAIPNFCFQSAPLREVVIPASVQSVGTTAFSFDDNLESIRIEDSDEAITFDGQQYATFDNGGARYTVYVGRDIKRTYRTGDSPFPQATSITWGPKVTKIGDGMAKSPYLVSAIIGNNVKSIGANAFHSAGNSSDAETLTITMGVNVESMGSSAFYNCSKLTALTLPSKLNAIPNYCFQSTPIREVVIPASVQSVGNSAFNFNDNMVSIRLENGSDPITFDGQGYATFDNGGATYTVYQGRNIKRTYRAGSSPFPQAVSVAFGPTVTEIGAGMYNCANITSITAGWQQPISITKNVFHESLYQSATLYVPNRTVSAYKAAPIWQDFFKIEEMEETKCYTPTATLADGRLHFECQTKGVTYHYKYTFPENGEGTGNDVTVGQTLRLELRATKAGLEDSDVAYYTLLIAGGGSIMKGDVNEDGTVDVADIATVITIMAQ